MGLEEEKNSTREEPAGPGISWRRGRNKNACGGGGGVADEKVAEKYLTKIFTVFVGKCNRNSSFYETL